MADIRHESRIRASRGRVLNALTDAGQLGQWHAADVRAEGGGLAISYRDGPAFHWEVIAATPDRVTWQCTRGPGDSPGTRVEFRLNDTGDGRTLLELEHSGWPGEHGNFRKCNTLWGGLLHRLREVVERPAATR